VTMTAPRTTQVHGSGDRRGDLAIYAVYLRAFGWRRAIVKKVPGLWPGTSVSRDGLMRSEGDCRGDR
jgi:hypothetical protein